jgi:DNA-binding transcriptional LysR family regulator
MNTLQNIRAFLLAARQRSFSAAAAELGVAPSVMTKRISQLEGELGVRLFIRSTRGLALTGAGEHYRPRLLRLVAELDDLFHGAEAENRGLVGSLRIKAPTTVTSLYLGDLFGEFHARHPGLTLDISLMDRSVNPLEEGFDVALGALPASYTDVADIPLGTYPRRLCAAPAYLARRGWPQHPRELADHDCLTSRPIGTAWTFDSADGPLSVAVHSRFNANDSRVLLGALCRGAGIGIFPTHLVRPELRDGRVVEVLADYPVALLHFKAMVPRIKAQRPEIRTFVAFLAACMQPVAPWEADAA